MPNSRKEAFELIDELGAPEHLKTHATLVGEAADLLIEANGLFVRRAVDRSFR